MEVFVRSYEEADLLAMMGVWNEVVEDGIAFPQEEALDLAGAREFFAAQSAVHVAEVEGAVLGLFILHPNNVGRCGHVANASFAVSSQARGKGVGRALVQDCLRTCAACGFRGLQFNAVVDSNHGARHLYESLGFEHVGVIPAGFRMKDGHFEDIHIYYHPTEAE